jgi:hypothetical protein
MICEMEEVVSRRRLHRQVGRNRLDRPVPGLVLGSNAKVDLTQMPSLTTSNTYIRCRSLQTLIFMLSEGNLLDLV